MKKFAVKNKIKKIAEFDFWKEVFTQIKTLVSTLTGIRTVVIDNSSSIF